MLDILSLAIVLHAAPAIVTSVPPEPVSQSTDQKSQEERRRRAARQKAAERKQNAVEGKQKVAERKQRAERKQNAAEGQNGKSKKKRTENERRRRAARKAAENQKFEMVNGMRVVRFDKPGGLRARVGPQLGKLPQEKAEGVRKGKREVGEKKNP